MIRGGGVPLEGLAFAVAQIGPATRCFAADAHGCIMVVGPRDPTEYKVVGARVPRPVASEPHSDYRSRCNARHWRVDWKCSASRLVLTRARFAAVGLDPSALPVCTARHVSALCADTSAKDKEGFRNTEALDK